MKPFHDELRTLLNGYSKENESNTPDFILTRYIERCLDAFDEATRARDKWYGSKHDMAKQTLKEDV